MVQSHSLVFPAILTFNVLCSATNIIPRAAHAAPKLPAFVELHDVIIGKRDGLDFRNALQPRTTFPASPPQERIFANSSSVITKRTLLGLRQSTCYAGYNLCYVSQRCCPDSGGNGECCDDGTCVTSSDTCCTTGGSCPSGQDCCTLGCKFQEDTCCTDDWSCPPGTFCCGDQNCAVNGGECCEGGTSCDSGLHCVIVDGVQGCCADYDCSSFSSGGGGGTATSSLTAVRSSTFTPTSFTPISSTDISITSKSFPSITIPSITVSTAPAANYIYYTTTFTWYFYRYYITFIAPSRIPTSSRTYTTKILSVYASNTADAASQFNSISSAVSFPSAFTDPGYISGLANSTPGFTGATPTHFSGGGATAVAGGAASGGGVGGWRWGCVD
ncbi:hypothetical protein ABVK25_005810 [Lepraria finkii]|uniref:GPI anchored protein n=1 Tax=Lepraria finkii TaxID=1340010 RepID=A0ABR4BAJ2_9LECA